MNLPLFCFGSLMDPDVLSLVLDSESLPERISMKPAMIFGFRKVRLPHETYPMLVPAAESDAPGVLIHGLLREDLDRIVFFEGAEYELAPCEVRLGNGDVMDALFFDEGIMPPPRTEQWDFEAWRRDHKDYLLRQSRVYMAWFGRMSATEADRYWQEYRE